MRSSSSFVASITPRSRDPGRRVRRGRAGRGLALLAAADDQYAPSSPVAMPAAAPTGFVATARKLIDDTMEKERAVVAVLRENVVSRVMATSWRLSLGAPYVTRATAIVSRGPTPNDFSDEPRRPSPTTARPLARRALARGARRRQLARAVGRVDARPAERRRPQRRAASHHEPQRRMGAAQRFLAGRDARHGGRLFGAGAAPVHRHLRGDAGQDLVAAMAHLRRHGARPHGHAADRRRVHQRRRRHHVRRDAVARRSTLR